MKNSKIFLILFILLAAGCVQNSLCMQEEEEGEVALRKEKPLSLYYNLEKQLTVQGGTIDQAKRLIEEDDLDVNMNLPFFKCRVLCSMLKSKAWYRLDEEDRYKMLHYLLGKGALIGVDEIMESMKIKDIFIFLLDKATITDDFARLYYNEASAEFFDEGSIVIFSFKHNIEWYLFCIDKFLSKGIPVLDERFSAQYFKSERYPRVYPLQMAVLHGSFDLVERLFAVGASIKREARCTPLKMVHSRDCQEKPIDKSDACFDYTPLDLVSRRSLGLGDHEEIARFLLLKGARATKKTLRRFQKDIEDEDLKAKLISLLHTLPSSLEEEMDRRERLSLAFDCVCPVGEEQELESEKVCGVCLNLFDGYIRKNLCLNPCGHNMCSRCLRICELESEEAKCKHDGCDRTIESVKSARRLRVRSLSCSRETVRCPQKDSDESCSCVVM